MRIFDANWIGPMGAQRSIGLRIRDELVPWIRIALLDAIDSLNAFESETESDSVATFIQYTRTNRTNLFVWCNDSKNREKP